MPWWWNDAAVTQSGSVARGSTNLRRVLAPLALAQFICSFAGPNMNVMISDMSEDLQGEISGLSRCVSNLGSSLGTAIAGTILVAGITATPERAYGLAMIALALVGLIGLIAAAMLPRKIAAVGLTRIG